MESRFVIAAVAVAFLAGCTGDSGSTICDLQVRLSPDEPAGPATLTVSDLEEYPELRAGLEAGTEFTIVDCERGREIVASLESRRGKPADDTARQTYVAFDGHVYSVFLNIAPG